MYLLGIGNCSKFNLEIRERIEDKVVTSSFFRPATHIYFRKFNLSNREVEFANIHSNSIRARDNYLKLMEAITVQWRTFIEDALGIIKLERGENEVERWWRYEISIRRPSVVMWNARERRKESGNVRKRRDVNKSKACQLHQ